MSHCKLISPAPVEMPSGKRPLSVGTLLVLPSHKRSIDVDFLPTPTSKTREIKPSNIKAPLGIDVRRWDRNIPVMTRCFQLARSSHHALSTNNVLRHDTPLLSRLHQKLGSGEAEIIKHLQLIEHFIYSKMSRLDLNVLDIYRIICI